MKKLVALCLTLLLVPLFSGAQEEPLDPDTAFKFSLESVGPDRVRATWDIADGYHLYRNKISFVSDTDGITLGKPTLPKGEIQHDEELGDLEIYRGKVNIDIPVSRTTAAPALLKLTAKSQGCADQGVCYPPHQQTASVTLPPAGPAPVTGGLGQLESLGKGSSVSTDGEALDPDVAFVFTPSVADPQTLVARWTIAPNHYLYRDKLSFALRDTNGIQLGKPAIPDGEIETSEFSAPVHIFHNELTVRLPLIRTDAAASHLTLVTRYQGCAESGICYPPITKTTGLSLPAATAIVQPPSNIATTTTVTTDGAEPLSEQDSLARSLASGNTLVTLATFFGLGLLLAFTPCVFPMIPILSSIIVGQGASLTTRKAFSLSLIYVLAMAVTYTIAGVIAGLFGSNLQAAFQNPWILGSFAAVFVVLAISMFGFFELQLPSGWQTRLSEISNRQQGGTLAGVGIMGLLSALIVGPCVAPPLMGALIYIGQTGDPWLGGTALFMLSLGMGAPLVAIGTAGGKLMPRAGRWMDTIKAVFGVLLIGVAVWMLDRILPPAVTMLLWALLVLISAIYMGALEPLKDGVSGWRRFWKGVGVAMLVWGALLLIGAARGVSDPLSPLAGLNVGAAQALPSTSSTLNFQRIATVDDLHREVSAAAARHQPVMLDFYADWCVSCKELDKYTFPDPGVVAALKGVTLLRADVTANNAADQALLKSLGLFGPPSILFWGQDGQEKHNMRVFRFMAAEPFRSHIMRAFGAN